MVSADLISKWDRRKLKMKVGREQNPRMSGMNVEMENSEDLLMKLKFTVQTKSMVRNSFNYAQIAGLFEIIIANLLCDPLYVPK